MNGRLHGKLPIIEETISISAYTNITYRMWEFCGLKRCLEERIGEFTHAEW
jgi:hypothetical protein